MHQTTALVLLKELARRNLLDVKMTTFMVPQYPQPVHHNDIKEAFIALADSLGHDPKEIRISRVYGIEARVSEKLFEKLFKIIFVNEKLFPAQKHEGNDPSVQTPLPTLFVNSEKTQFRQIPLAEQRPWPFRFLLELGGMIVVRTSDYRDMLLELKQFLNNHPRFEVRVTAKERPDGTIAIMTYWFRELPKIERKGNVNVPE